MLSLVVFAEIADKMTAKEDLWIVPFRVGCFMAVMTVAFAMAKLRAGWVGVGIALLFGILFICDTSLDLDIRRELGDSYLVLRKLVGFIPLVLTSAVFSAVWFVRRKYKSAE